ncbi:MAG: hypothetical protein HY725_22990 [Candidatus Rokubacteria bacterium]|nr:hypothetical protein [Candidatus Rokubacteria bacterium]
MTVTEAVSEEGEIAQPQAQPAALPLEECRTLFQGAQYEEVIRTAEPALQGAFGEPLGTPPRAAEVAALWSVLGLSRQALGDEEGARSALEEAIHAAPEDDRPTYRQQLVSLAAGVSRRLLLNAEQVAEGAGEQRIDLLKQAMVWLYQGLMEVPEDGELTAALERARRGLWGTYGQTVTSLIQRQEFHRARRLIREALADEEFPADRRQVFMELLSATFIGEIGQLTASAIRTLEDEREREALTFLQRAEGILGSLPPEAIAPKRREEVNRRLWWGYTKLGLRRVEAGEYEGAIEPLFHALKIGEIGPERQQETRETLGRALEAVVETRAASITQLAKEGKRSAAVQEAERLKSLIRESLELGLSEQELSPALSRARKAIELLEQGT